LTATADASVRRIGQNQIEAGGSQMRNLARAQIRTDRRHSVDPIQRRVAPDKRRQLRLQLDRDNSRRFVKLGDHDRDDAASRAQFEHALAGTASGEAPQQDRFDREAVSVARLDQLESPA